MNNGKGYIRPVIDAARCDGCGDCAALAPGIFRQAGKEPAVIGDPEGGPFKPEFSGDLMLFILFHLDK
ncbi:MAG: ferredoxin [Candidatus Hydrogenedentes bacterium]|nr:ferredoxin [Candidatus Hydrogenedentota bacterium]